MMRGALICLALLCATGAAAESLLAARTLRAREVIVAADLTVAEAARPGALSRIEDAVGREARTTIYAGQPIFAANVADAAVVERNEIVELVYTRGGLSIRTEGRALDRGAVGARLRVMNLASRQTVTGTVAAPGRVSVP